MSVEAQSRPTEVFSASVAIILLLVGVFSFSAYITLSTFAPDFASGDNAEAHALSRSAIGFSGIVKLTRLNGAHVTVTRAPPSATASAAPLVVLTPQTKVTQGEIDRLGDTSVLIVLPKWLAFPSFTHKGWVGEGRTIGPAFAEEVLEEIAPGAKIVQEPVAVRPLLHYDAKAADSPGTAGTMHPGSIKALQSLSGAELTPVVTTVDGKTVLSRLKEKETDDEDFEDHPTVYILSDPDFLNNQGIADLGTARTGLAILSALRKPADPMSFDVTLNGLERTRSLLRLAFEPPLLAATLSLLIVAGLLAWRAAVRSGPAIRGGRAIALGKRTLADNSAALIRLAGRGHTMAPRYADMVRTVVAENIHIARDAHDTTAAELDRIAQSHKLPATYSELAREAAAAQSPAATLTIARKLHAWTGDMIRATR